jgi:hypothetical protein
MAMMFVRAAAERKFAARLCWRIASPKVLEAAGGGLVPEASLVVDDRRLPARSLRDHGSRAGVAAAHNIGIIALCQR